MAVSKRGAKDGEKCIHISSPGGERAETRGQKNTHVTNVDGKVQSMEDAVNDTTCGHETGVDGTTDDATEGVPCCGVEPVPKCL